MSLLMKFCLSYFLELDIFPYRSFFLRELLLLLGLLPF